MSKLFNDVFIARTDCLVCWQAEKGRIDGPQVLLHHRIKAGAEESLWLMDTRGINQDHLKIGLGDNAANWITSGVWMG